MAKVRIGINGFGRIGRCAFKIAEERGDVEVVGLNDLADNGDLAYLLKYDSVHGWYSKKIASDAKSITVGGKKYPFFAEKDPSKLPWGDLGADVVIESTGAFKTGTQAGMHIEGGAKRVIISAPAEEVDGTFVLGVNHKSYDPAKHRVISNASCTTNSLAPVAKVLNDAFGIEHLLITTCHAYTSSQALVDIPAKKRRRGRAAALSIIPTSTGAAKATGLVIPELKGKLDGMALRVPTPDGSVTDIVANLKKSASKDAINDALRKAADGPDLKGILRVSDEELVSHDIIGDHHSSIVDAISTMVLAEKMVKVLAWYDNEWGYAARCIDFAELMVEKGV